MNDNLKLWETIDKTPLDQTKKITGKSYQGTSPKPHWIIWKTTETFGPCGIGWGFTIDERIEDGALIADGVYEKMHIAKVSVWYKWGDDLGKVEHVGGTPFSGVRASGKSYTDEDAPKKSVTDALIKALSMIGFAGDIFMGRYDDSKYIEELRNDAKPSKPKSTALSKDKARTLYQTMEMACRDAEQGCTLKEFDEWKATQVDNYNLLPTDWQKSFRDQCASVREVLVGKAATEQIGA